ncbi:gliding motility-associated C-terminal domain-containing protein [Hymenobacter terrestris]|uniref:Gliding motility-associated C-terminal domain-containing protein n=1 Tax=Hymenobacter terrestris TaxID=2748310 RepID=A0ABX2Q9K3_9BACT|nr:gliding motility-associated C-terminal domain-containing protein [Hymenobacter terrestris]NVO86656.1 gliding motility-associated C-terminal domain-containing protein [Hymenobacter terrestris]
MNYYKRSAPIYFRLSRATALLVWIMALLAAPMCRAQAPTWRQLIAIEQLNSRFCTVTAIEPEGSDAMYIAGHFEGTVRIGTTVLTSAGGTDGFVAKWRRVGQGGSFTWALRFGGTADEEASALGRNGVNVYVAGIFRSPTAAFGARALTNRGTPGTSDGFVAQLNDGGNNAFFQWCESVSGTANERITSLRSDGRRVFVGGSFGSPEVSVGALRLRNTSTGANTDGFIASLYDNGPNATVMWFLPISGAQSEEVTGVVMIGAKTYVVGGFSGSTAAIGATVLSNNGTVGTRDIFVAVVADAFTSGTFMWAYSAGGPGDDWPEGAARTAGGGDGIFLVGAFSGPTARFGASTVANTDASGATTDAFITRVEDAGPTADFAWVKRAGGTGNDVARGVRAFSESIHVVGDFENTAIFDSHSLTSAGPPGVPDIFVGHLNAPCGSVEFDWVQRAGGPGPDYALGLFPYGASTSGSPNEVYVVGRTQPQAQFSALNVPGAAGTVVGYLATIEALPSATACIVGDTLVCSGGRLTLNTSVSGPVTSYRWSTGATSASIQVTQPGIYTVQVVFATGQTRTVRHRVGAVSLAISIAGDSVLCANAALTLLGMAPNAVAYEWNTGATTPALTVTQPGTYTLTARYPAGCTATRRVVVRRASVAVTGPAQACPGSPNVLTAVAPGATAYRWNTGDTTPTLAVTQVGTYTVTASFPGGCSLSASHTVAVPVAAISGDSLLCAVRPVQLAAGQSGATAYRWSTGATTPIISVTQPGLYSVVVVYDGGCQSSASYRVRSLPDLPPLILGADTTLCEGSALFLQPLAAIPPGATYRWSTGAATPGLLVQQAGTYTLTVSTACETRTATRQIGYRPCVRIPNIITPNGDPQNETFIAQGLIGKWSLQIYNRWGRQVYATDAYRHDWGPGAAPGVYYYLLQQEGNPLMYKGWLKVAL